jgi:hypothetical protein
MPLGPRRTARRIRARGPRRTTTWATLDQTVTMAANGQNNLDIWAGLETAGSSAVGLTVMRTLVTLNIAPMASGTSFIRAGLLITDKGNVGTAVNLADSANLDWYWYQDFYPAVSGAAFQIQTWPTDGRPFDIRARRRTNDLGRTSVLALSNHNGASTLFIQMLVRQLVALP